MKLSIQIESAIPRIKIIKRAERKQLAQTQRAKRLPSTGQVALTKARDAALTITGWIRHSQLQKQESAEKARSFKNTDSLPDKK